MTSKRSFSSLLISIIVPLLLLVFPARIGTAAKRANARAVDEVKQRSAASYGKLPLSFEINQGQTDPRVKFLSRGGGYTLFLTGNEAVLSLQKATGVAPPFSAARAGLKPGATTSVDKPTTDNGARTTIAVLRTRLVGANVKAAVTGAEELPGTSNYFIGNDPQKWRTNVPNYAKVRYQGVYPGIDLVYYGNQGGQLEYDFVVAPGADPSVVTLEVGAEGVRPAKGQRRSPLQIAADGDLVVKTEGGEIRFQKPVVYQPMRGDPKPQVQNRKLLDGRYVLLAGNRVGFEIPNYDKTKPLVIDPVLTYSTYLGGSGDENPYGLGGVAVDASGNAYVTAYTQSINFPITVGAYQTTSSTGSAFVTKFNASGSEHVYSTYFGGNLAITTAIAVDTQGYAYIAGYTWPNGIPTTTGAFQTVGAGIYPNAFIAKLDPTGSSLVYSTYVGGTANTEAFALAVDSTGNAYVAGQTNSTDFPTTSNGADRTCGTDGLCNPSGGYGTLDAFFLELDPTGSNLLYSTYLGGSDVDIARGVALDASGNAYVAGFTFSSDFPTTPGAFQTSGSLAAFVVKVAPSLSGSSSVIYSTLLNGSGDDRGTGIAVDPAGNAYVVGITNSSNFPATPGAFQPTPGGGYDAFVAKLNPAGSGLVYCTYLGGSSDEGFEYGTDAIGAIALDASGNAYVTGYTRSGNFPTASPLQPGLGGGGSSCPASDFIPAGPCPDAYVAKLNSAGSALIFSTYLGGSADDKGIGVAVDGSGNVYAVGTTQSSDFPVMNAFQSSNAGATDAFVVKLSGLALPVTTLSSLSLNFGNQIVGTTSAPQTVTLTNAGDAPLTISGLALTGTNAGDYAQTNTCPISPATLNPGSTCTISVTFTPGQIGTLTGTLTITDNSNDVAGSTQTVALSGGGVTSITGPAVSLAPPSLTFPAQTLETTSLPQVVTLTNTGALPLTIFSIVTSANYTQTSTCTPPYTLASLAHCFISVTFTATVAGPDPGTLTITDNNNGVPGSTQTVGLSGTGASPVPQINQPLVPESAVPGGAGFTLTVNGAGFVSGSGFNSVVKWNGSALATTFVSANQLTAMVPATDIATAGTSMVTVVNPSGPASNVVFFQITNLTPSVSLANAPGSPIAVASPPGGTGSNPISIAVGDFNGDGKLDLAIANNCVSCSPDYPSTLTIVLGNGDGTFITAPGSPITVAFGPEFVGAGDFNGDGNLDLAVANMFGNGLTILLGNGHGTFTPAAGSPIAVGVNPVSFAIGDFNGDGKLDLAVTNGSTESHNLTILLGNGDGTFTPVASPPATGSGPAGIAIGDFNGDGKPDLAVTNVFDNTVTILLGNGDGTFTPTASSPLAVGTFPWAVAAGDFNGDGKLDLAVANIQSNNVTVLLGKGDGTFTPASGSPVAVGIGPNAVAVGDFNGDGKLDLAVSNHGSNNVTILLGNGNGTFTPASGSPVAVGTGPDAVAVGDFNRDGRLDLATANNSGNTVSILLQVPVASPSPTSLPFGNQNVGTTSGTQSVTLTNTGSAPMAISSVSLSGANAANFALPGNTCPMLTPPASCAPSTWFFNAFPVTSPPFSSIFYVTAPNANGDRLVVGAPTGGTPAFITALNLVPAPNATNQEFCDFVQLVTGVQALAYVPTAAERGGNFSAFASLFIDPLTGLLFPGGIIPLSRSDVWAWRVPGNAFSPPAGLAPGATCAINVSFSPLTTGASSAQVTIGDNASGAFQVISLSGTGVYASTTGPAVSLAPASLSFPAQNVGTTSSPLVVTLTNSGVSSLTISSIATSSDYAQTNTCLSPSPTLAPLANCSISVTFTPTVAGSDPGTLTITDNAGTQSVPLAATFTTPRQPVSPNASTTFTNAAIMSETVTLPPDVIMNGTVSKAVSFIPVPPAVFSSTRLPGTPQYPNWSGGITPIPAQTSCTVIANTGGNCMVIRDLCYNANGNPITCDITAPTTPIQLTAQYGTTSSPSCPGYIIADDNKPNWANITNAYYPGDTTIGGGTKTLNTDTAVVDLGAGNCVPFGATFTTAQQPVSPGTSTTFTNPAIMSETVTLPSDAIMNGTASKAVRFIPVSPAVFSSTRLPGTPQSPNWSGGITPIPAGTTCTVIANTGGNCVVIRDLCYDLNGNSIKCDITAPTTPIQLTAHYETPSSPSCPGYIIADDDQTNWAVITNAYSPGDTTIGGGTKTLNTDTAVVDLGAVNCVTSTTGPAVSLAPPSLSFPAPSSPLVVTLTNTGVSPLTISSIATSATSGDYTQTNTCPIPPATLAPQANCIITVTFTRTVPGSDPGTLTITDNASDSPQSVSLAATFTTPQQPVSPGTSTTFNNATIMSETVLLPPDANMTGTGTVATAFKAVSFIPVTPAVFSSTRLPGTKQDPNWSGGSTPIPAGTTCTVIAGTGGNCIVIRDLCFDSNHKSITCDITAPTTPIQLTSHYETPSPASCPGYIIADDGQPNWAVITNEYYPSNTTIGGGTKTLNTDTAVVDLGAGNCASAFSGTTAPTTSAVTIPSMPNGANGWFTTSPVTVILTSTDTTLVKQIDYSINGVAQPTVHGASTLLQITNQGVTTISYQATDEARNVEAPKTLAVKIDTTPPVVSVTGVTNGATYTFGAVPTAGCNTTDAISGVATKATVKLTGGVPPGVGSFTATCSGAVDVAGNPQAAPVTATYTVTPGPLASVSPSSINFGTVYLGTITTKNVTVTNQGDAPMTITDPLLSIVSGGNWFVALNLCPKSLAAGKSCTIYVIFVAGPYYAPQTATLKVMDNAPGSPQTVVLSATVINPQAHLSATGLSFGTQKVGTSSAAKAVTLTNTGATALAITSIAIAGTNPLDFVQTNNCPSSLAANAGCTVYVTFKPTASGLRSASAVITDNAQNSPQNISLSGTGK